MQVEWLSLTSRSQTDKSKISIIILYNYDCYISLNALQLTLPDHSMLSRGGHSVTAISLAPCLTEVTIFGGSCQFVDEALKLAATAIMNFGK